MEKKKVSKNQFIISLVFNGANTLLFLYYIIETMNRPSLFIYLTIWSYYLNSIFILVCLLCDIFIYVSSSSSTDDLDYKLVIDEDNKLESETKGCWQKLNDWNRNKFGIICNTLCYFISISFWILYFLGEKYVKISKSPGQFFSTVYHHLLITIIVIIDVFYAYRESLCVSGKFFGIISLVYFGYFIMAYIAKYLFGINIYAFMNGASFGFLVFYATASYAFLFLCYLFHVWLVNLRIGKKNEKEDNNEEEIKLIE